MRIAYISADRGIPVFGNKGASIHIREMVTAFSRLGCEITVYATRSGPNAEHFPAEIVEVGNEEEVLPTDPALKRLRREEAALAASEEFMHRVCTAHDSNPFDCIYERYSLFSTAGVAAARRLGIPCVVEVNAPLVSEQQQYRQLLKVDEALAVERALFEQAQVVLTVSEALRAYVIARGHPERTHVMPNAVDTERFNPQVEPMENDALREHFVVGFVGSLKPWHGVEELLRAFRQLALQSSRYHLLVVGDGPLKTWLEGYVVGADLEDRVTITGWKPCEDLPSAIKTMHVAVAPYPASEWFYFSPLKLVEYLAVGTPVVASNIGQISDLLKDGVNGLLVIPGDAGGLADAIRKLEGDPALCEALGRQAVASVAQRTWVHNARRVLELVAPHLGGA